MCGVCYCSRNQDGKLELVIGPRNMRKIPENENGA